MTEIETFIETGLGKKVNFFDISENDIDIRDIAASLSKICRFTGHCSRFYSVAEHSIILSNISLDLYTNPKLSLFYLLHDAHEAYCQDLATPLKNYLKAMSMWDEIEKIQNQVDKIIFDRYSISGIAQMHKDKPLDKQILLNEKLRLFPKSKVIWEYENIYSPIDEDLFNKYFDEYSKPEYTFKSIEKLFLTTFKNLNN
jgi:hypothetical protein